MRVKLILEVCAKVHELLISDLLKLTGKPSYSCDSKPQISKIHS